MENYLDNLINDFIHELCLTRLEKLDITNHAKQIYIELLKLEYPAATDTHRESLAKQAFLYAIQFHKAIQNF